MRFIRIATDLAEKVWVWAKQLLQVSVANADIRAGPNKPDDFYKIPEEVLLLSRICNIEQTRGNVSFISLWLCL